VSSQLTRRQTKGSLAGRIFNPEKVLWQSRTKTAMDFANPLDGYRTPACQTTAVDPFLHGDMCGRFFLEVALRTIRTVFVLESTLDVHRVRVVSFDKVGVIAVGVPSMMESSTRPFTLMSALVAAAYSRVNYP
jgi:hypothetical protein